MNKFLSAFFLGGFIILCIMGVAIIKDSGSREWKYRESIASLNLANNEQMQDLQEKVNILKKDIENLQIKELPKFAPTKNEYKKFKRK